MHIPRAAPRWSLHPRTNTPAPTAAPEQSAQPTQAPAATANPDADVTMDIGQNTTISGGSGTIWSSSNERVATVDQSGNVTAHAEGEAVIYAISEDGSKRYRNRCVRGQSAGG